jgi:hypothetical protein
MENGVRMKIIGYYLFNAQKNSVAGSTPIALRKQIKAYAKHNRGHVVKHYVDRVRQRNTAWPGLEQAVEHAQRIGAKLVIAKIGRLVDNVAFTTILMNSHLDFVTCDKLHIDKDSIALIATEAHAKATEKSRITRDALASAKANGQKLGSARRGHWKGREHLRGWKKGAENSAKLRTERAHAAYEELLPEMQKMAAEAKEIRRKLRGALKKKIKALDNEYDPQIQVATDRGQKDRVKALTKSKEAAIEVARADATYPTYDRIAEHLNAKGHQTTAGFPFTGTAVWRILKREELAPTLTASH